MTRTYKKQYTAQTERPRRQMTVPDFHGDIRVRPINLHDVEIRAGLRGAKCEIRRPLRVIEQFGQIANLVDLSDGHREQWQFGKFAAPDRAHYTLTGAELLARSPYGPRGTLLAVNEYWANTAPAGETPQLLYRADMPTKEERMAAAAQGLVWLNKPEARPVPPRLVYRIVDVWIDRLQPMIGLQLRNEGWLDSRIAKPSQRQVMDSRRAFVDSWDRSVLDDASKWSANPWVWVMSVERVRDIAN
jgi:hypothetical protein